MILLTQGAANQQCSLSPLTPSASTYNMRPLQARGERRVSAQAKWVRENEAGMSPSPAKKDDPPSQETHPATRRCESLFLMGTLRQICTEEPRTCAPHQRHTLPCAAGGAKLCQGREALPRQERKTKRNSKQPRVLYFSLAASKQRAETGLWFAHDKVFFFSRCCSQRASLRSNVYQRLLVLCCIVLFVRILHRLIECVSIDSFLMTSIS